MIEQRDREHVLVESCFRSRPKFFFKLPLGRCSPTSLHYISVHHGRLASLSPPSQTQQPSSAPSQAGLKAVTLSRSIFFDPFITPFDLLLGESRSPHPDHCSSTCSGGILL